MSRFEMKVVVAKRISETEVVTEEKDYICFCYDKDDYEEVSERARLVVKDEIEFAEGEVLFGSADVCIDDETVLVFGFRNKDCDTDGFEDLLDLILDHDSETIH